jgi:hypothetical protein
MMPDPGPAVEDETPSTVSDKWTPPRKRLQCPFENATARATNSGRRVIDQTGSVEAGRTARRSLHPPVSVREMSPCPQF